MPDDKTVTLADIKALAQAVAAEKDVRRQGELATKLAQASQALREASGV